jgi:hypothetical protein
VIYLPIALGLLPADFRFLGFPELTNYFRNGSQL